jgi:hypothetical protein
MSYEDSDASKGTNPALITESPFPIEQPDAQQRWLDDLMTK